MQDIGRYVLGPIAVRMFPALIATFLYGAVNFIIVGVDRSRYTETYAPTFGALLSFVGIFAYGMAMPYGPSLAGMVLALAGFIPYVFALFIMIGLGGARLYGLLSGFSVSGMLAGVFWIGVGYWLLLLVLAVHGGRCESGQGAQAGDRPIPSRSARRKPTETKLNYYRASDT